MQLKSILKNIQRQAIYKYDAILNGLEKLVGKKVINLISSKGFKFRRKLLADFGKNLAITSLVHRDIMQGVEVSFPIAFSKRATLLGEIESKNITVLVNGVNIKIAAGILYLYEIDMFVTLANLVYGNNDTNVCGLTFAYSKFINYFDFDPKSYFIACLHIATISPDMCFDDISVRFTMWRNFLDRLEAVTNYKCSDYVEAIHVLDETFYPQT
jgi:hypothetical protein